MTLPALPAKGSTDWYSHYTALDGAVRDLLVADTTDPGSGGGTDPGTGGGTGGGTVDPSAQLALWRILGPRFAVGGATDWLVSVSSGRTVSIAPGAAVASGTVDSTTAATTLTLDANTGAQTRYDLIVRRWTWTTDGSGNVTSVSSAFAVIKGTIGAAPPTTRSLVPGGIYDALIAIVAVRASVTTLLASDLTDMRVYGGAGGALTRAVGAFMAYVDAIVGTEVLVLANSPYGWQRFIYHGAGVWRGTRVVTLQQSTFTATTLTSSNGTTETAIATLSITDPGYPYQLEVAANVQVAAAASSPGHIYARLDSTTGTLLSAEALRSGQLPAGELVSLALAPFTSAALTGNHSVVVTLSRMTGATGNVAVTAGGNLLAVKIRPA